MGVNHACRSRLGDGLVDLRRHKLECLVPRDGSEVASALGAGATHGLGQAGLGVPPHPVVGNGTFAAERPAAYRMIGVAQNLAGAAIATHHGDAA